MNCAAAGHCRTQACTPGTTAQSKSTIAGFNVRIVSTCTNSELTKKYARSVRQPRRNTPCSGRRANNRSIGTNSSE